MRRPVVGRTSKRSSRPITAADVGRYVRGLAVLNKDVHIGNAELSEALFRLADVLIAAKAVSAEEAARRAIDQNELLFADELDFENVELDKVRQVLDDEQTGKSTLLILAVERLGMPRSRLEKMPRDELVRTLKAAVQHEESLSIISEEARRGGERRAS